MSHLSRQTGISLVEVLISLVIGLMLLAGVVQVYSGNKATFRFTNALAEIQENGRFALEIITQDLRLANSWGCVAPNGEAGVNSNINNTLTTWSGYDTEFHDFVGNEAISGTDGAGLNGSDTITIMGSKPGQTNVEVPFQAATTTSITTNEVSFIEASDIILVARCGSNDSRPSGETAEADIHRVTSIAPSGPGDTQRDIGLSQVKSQQFESDAIVIELQSVTYSVEQNSDDDGRPSLWRTEFGANRQELVEGVDNMQILYGVDTDADGYPNQYLKSDDVTDFANVVAVRISLLLHSLDEVVRDAGPQVYSYNGVDNITAPDGRIRQVFSTTIALRNRIGKENDTGEIDNGTPI